MSDRHRSWIRRKFVERMGIVAAVGLLRRPVNATAEPPLETTRLRLPHLLSVCLAPQVLAEDLLRAEGFTDVQYVRLQGPVMTANMKALAAGETDLAGTYTTNTVIQIDAGDPVVLLAGVHVGCFELFGSERVRAVRDLRSRKVSVPVFGVSHQRTGDFSTS